MTTGKKHPAPEGAPSAAERALGATSVTTLSRVPVFQPSNRPRPLLGEESKTAYGSCKVTGRLGQRHFDLLDAILFHAEKSRVLEDGGVELLVDPHRVRKTLSNSRASLPQIRQLIAELRAAVIEIDIKRSQVAGGNLFCLGGLVDHVVPSTQTRSNPLGGERRLWRVRLGKLFVYLLQHDHLVRYDPAPVARLRHSLTKAVMRHILSHAVQPLGGWKLDTLILAIDGEAKGGKLRKARHLVLSEQAALGQQGINVDPTRKRVSKKQAPSV